MDILLKPDSLSFVGSMNHFVISTPAEISFTLYAVYDDVEKIIIQHTYTPDNTNRIDIDLTDVVLPMLQFELKDVSDIYRQDRIIRKFTAEITPTDTKTPVKWAFSVLRAGVDRFSDVAANFLKANFLTWQPNLKPVTYYTPEFLTYYAVDDCKVKCTAHIDNAGVLTERTLELGSLAKGYAWTIPVQYGIIAGKLNANPSYYDIFVEDLSGNRLTYIQRYYPTDIRSEEEVWVLFENSLGGIDTFRAYGSATNTAKHTHNVAEIEGITEEYRVDTEREFKKNTGHLDKRERQWLLDFFPSLVKYVYVGSYLRRIVVTDSEVSYTVKELPSGYSFTYKYADAKPYLNLPRTEPATVLDIKVPEMGSFTLAPRLVELPALPLSDGALFPIQNPYSQEWRTTNVAALFAYLTQSIVNGYKGDGSIGHTHNNMSVLNALTRIGMYLYLNAQKISAGYADKAGTADALSDNSIDWDKVLRKDQEDSTNFIIKFLKGIQFGNGDCGINRHGMAILEAVQTHQGYAVGNYEKGTRGAVLADINGDTYLEVDNAYFRKKAVFESLEVMKTMYSYGNRIAGKGGVKVTRVEEQANAYRCYFLHEQDGLKIENPFVLNDQVIVKEANVKEGTTEHTANHFLWRAVVAVGENYVDLSKAVCASGSDKPLPGDALCQLGYRGTDKPDRQCAIMERTVGEDVPAYVMLQGINDFTLEGKDILSYGWDATKKRAYMKNYGETYVGSRDKKQFIEYTPEDGLNIEAKSVKITAGGTTTNVGDGIKNANQGISNLTQRVSSAEVKANGIELKVERRKVGGVNLLRGTAFNKLPEWNTDCLEIGNDPSIAHNGRNYIKITAAGFTKQSFKGVFLRAVSNTKTEYTASVWVRTDDVNSIDNGIYSENFFTKGKDHTRVHSVGGQFVTDLQNGKWVRVVRTFSPPDDIDFDGVEFNTFALKNGTLYLSEPQLEVGNVPTDWSENPDDVKNQIEEAGLKITQGLIELNGKSVFKNGNAPAVPLFDENGKVNPKLSTAQYLMNVLRSMETMIDGGLVIAGLMAAKDGEQVTAYLNGLQQKAHALAAGVKNFGTENETTVSHINFDGSAKFGNLGISADGRVNIIDAAGKPRINITPDELPSDDELLKTADEDKTYNLPEIHWGPNNDDNWTTPQVSQTFNISNDNSAVTLKILLRIGSTLMRVFTDGEAHNAACVLKLKNLTKNYETYVDFYGGLLVLVENNQIVFPSESSYIFGRSIIETIRISKSLILGKGNWQLVVEPRSGLNVFAKQLSMSQISIDVSFKSGRQNFSLAHNGFASVNSNHQAAYIRDGKLHAFGEMNIPGILLAGTVSSGGILSNAWGEFASGTGLTYNDAGGVQVIRLTFNAPLPCGSNYVVSVVPNEYGAVYGCMAVIRRKTERYCEFRIVNDSGGEVGDVGLDFIVVGRNK
nr:MAG TPA: Neck appendage protein [Caudoviricetes sp.]